MATETSSCGVCLHRHISKTSIVWCTQCDEGLCVECQEHHSFSKSSRKHTTITISEYQKLPPDISNISQYCKIHNEKYLLYCKKHESPCCGNCIVERHKECRDIVKLVDVIGKVKTSNYFYEIEQMVSEISKSIKKIRENCQYNFKTLSEQRSKIENEIEQDRITINDYLDKLQKDTLKELHEMEKKTNKEIHQVIQSLDEKENKTMEFQRNISTIKQHASDLHAFLAFKKLENDVLAEEKFLQSLIDNNCLKQYSLIYQPNSTFKPSSLGTFGQVLIETKLLDFVLIGIKGKQAQMTVHKKGPKSFEDISLRLHRAINGTGLDIRGCSLLQDDKTVFTNHSSDSIRILKKDGSLDYDVKLWHYAYDVECITKDTLVVTSGDSNSKCISIVDMKYNGVKKRIPLDSDSYGIAGTDPEGDFIYSGGEKGIHRINLHEKLYSQIFLEENPSYCCVATFGNNIYHTNCITNSVTCSDVKGDKQWTFNDDTILMFPFGISVDNNGNVFVVGRHSQNVVVISADGKRHREVLSLEDGLSNPVCLHYDRSTNQLLVANDHSRAFIYDCV